MMFTERRAMRMINLDGDEDDDCSPGLCGSYGYGSHDDDSDYDEDGGWI